MSGPKQPPGPPDDGLPPHDRDTLPEGLIGNDTTTEPPPPPDAEVEPMIIIPKGWATHAFYAACSDLQRALNMVLATGDAIARALDEQDAP